MSGADNIEEYRRMLRINQHRLDDELEIQSETLERIGQNLTRAERQVAEAKEKLEATVGRLTEQYKDEDSKITVKEIDAKLQRNPQRASAWEAHQEAVAEQSAWSRLFTAWSNRGKDIKVLADLYGSQYWSKDSTYASGRAGRASYENLRASAAKSREPEDQPRTRTRMRLPE